MLGQQLSPPDRAVVGTKVGRRNPIYILLRQWVGKGHLAVKDSFRLQMPCPCSAMEQQALQVPARTTGHTFRALAGRALKAHLLFWEPLLSSGTWAVTHISLLLLREAS